MKNSIQNLELTPEQLSEIIANNEIVSNGNNSIVYRLDDDTLFKFQYSDYVEFFEQEDSKLNLRKLGDISDKIASQKNIERIVNRGKGSQDIIDITKAIHLQRKIKRTKFPIGFATVNGHRVGYMLPYHKGMTNLKTYLNSRPFNNDEKSIIIENIRLAISELLTRKIYLFKLQLDNILIDPSTLEIQLIDIDDSLIVSDLNIYNFSRNTIRQFSTIRDHIIFLENENPNAPTQELY